MIEERRAAIAVVGLGWMGLSTAALYIDSGAKVIGADRNPMVVDLLNRGKSTLDEPGVSTLIKKGLKEERFKATENVEDATAESDAIHLIVPTMIDEDKNADYTMLIDASRRVGKGLRPGSCIIVNSTCAPTVTERLVKPTLEKYSGLEAGEGFYLAYSPIRAMIGRALKDISSYPRIVGGWNGESLKRASMFLSLISKGELVKVDDMRTAEAAKIFETVYRDVNIALANEFAILCEKMNINYREAMEAANTQPYSHLHNPGIGVGGHCLPVYPYLLLTEARNHGVKLSLVKQARIRNEEMPRNTLRMVNEGLKEIGRTVKRSKIAVLGVSYRANVKELRYSPSLELIELMKKRGGKVSVYDPKFEYSELQAEGLDAKPSLRMAMDRCHCVVIAVAHDEFKSLRIEDVAASTSTPAVLIDCVELFDPREVMRMGLVYRGLGRGKID